MNCWEFKKCGRESGGFNSKTMGICPAATESKLDGIHEGKNAGRCCWVIKGTLCDGEQQGDFFTKTAKCLSCDFYKKTWREEQKNNYKTPTEILNLLNKD